MFYPVENTLTLNKGDTVAARCTMVSYRYSTVQYSGWLVEYSLVQHSVGQYGIVVGYWYSPVQYSTGQYSLA